MRALCECGIAHKRIGAGGRPSPALTRWQTALTKRPACRAVVMAFSEDLRATCVAHARPGPMDHTTVTAVSRMIVSIFGLPRPSVFAPLGPSKMYPPSRRDRSNAARAAGTRSAE